MKSTSGFSLIEVMCAILILGVALVGISQGITTALVSSKESEMQTAAAPIAAGRIEVLRADKSLKDGETEGECGTELPLYRWKQTISPTEIEGLHEVKVVVEQSSPEKEIFELKTMLFDAGSITDDKTKEKPKKEKSKKKKEGKA